MTSSVNSTTLPPLIQEGTWHQLLGLMPVSTQLAKSLMACTCAAAGIAQWPYPHAMFLRWTRRLVAPALLTRSAIVSSWNEGTRRSHRLCSVIVGILSAPDGVKF